MDEVWETSIVQRDGYIDVYLKLNGACITIGGSSPEPYFTTHGLAYLPLVAIASPELIPQAIGAMRSLIGALEAM